MDTHAGNRNVWTKNGRKLTKIGKMGKIDEKWMKIEMRTIKSK